MMKPGSEMQKWMAGDTVSTATMATKTKSQSKPKKATTLFTFTDKTNFQSISGRIKVRSCPEGKIMDKKGDTISYSILKNVGIDLNRYLGYGLQWQHDSRSKLKRDEAKNWEIVKNNFPSFKDYETFIAFIRVSFFNYQEKAR
jgi:hypothetical protein